MRLRQVVPHGVVAAGPELAVPAPQQEVLAVLHSRVVVDLDPVARLVIAVVAPGENGLIQNLLSDGVLVAQRLQYQKFIQRQ